MISGPAQ